MKFLYLFLFTTILSFSGFSQTINNDKFSLIGKIQFTDKKEKALQVSPLENGVNLLLIGKNEVRLWKPFESKVVYSSSHGLYENRGFLSKLIKFQNPVIVDRLGTKGIIISEEKGKDNDAAVVWDLQKGEKVAVLERSKKPTRWAEFSDNGKVIITQHGDLKDAEIAFWDAETYAYRSSIDVQDLAWYKLSPDGEKVFTISGKAKKWLGVVVVDYKDANGVGLWDTKSGEFEKEFKAENITIGNQYVAAPKLSKDGKLLILETEKGVVVWNTNDNGKPLQIISSKNAEEKIRSAGISPDEKYVLTAEDDKIKFYDFAEGKFYIEFAIRKDQTFELTNDNKFAVLRSSGNASIMEIDGGKIIKSLSIKKHERDYDQECFEPCEYEIEALKISPNSKYILIYGNEDVRVFDLPTGKLLQRFAHPQNAKFKKNNKIKDNGLSGDAGWLADKDALYVADKDRKEYLVWQTK